MKIAKPLLVVLTILFMFIGGIGCTGSNLPQSNSQILATVTPDFETDEIVIQSEPSAPMQYDDPFAYCAAVGTIDQPDTQYTGNKMPETLIRGMVAQGLVTGDAPSEIQQNAIWRCMDNQVWICHFGANLPCLEQANTLETPSFAMEIFCQENPEAENIPTVVTGRATVYEWGCEEEEPKIIRQLFERDPQGFLANFWHELTPNTVSEIEIATPSTAEEDATNTNIASLTLCQTIQDAASKALQKTFTIEEDVPYTDPRSDETVLSCKLTTTGTGNDFSFQGQILFDLIDAFGDWKEDSSYRADSPTSGLAGMTKNNDLMLFQAGWELAADVGCPDNQPISSCDYQPEQQIYLVEITVIEEGDPTAIDKAKTAVYKPVSLEVCQTIQETASQALATTFTIEPSAPFTNPHSRETGLGCRLTTTGTGVDFPEPVVLVLPRAFDDWTEQISYGSGGPMGTSTGLTSDMGLMLISSSWEPDPEVDCPSDQPISACGLEPEQMLYTIQIQIAQEQNK